MPPKQDRAYLPKKEADLIRRVIGRMLRPRASLTDLATKHELDYDVFREFIRGRASSLPTESDRAKIKAAAIGCLSELDLKTLEDAERLPPYVPRLPGKPPSPFELIVQRLNHKLVALLRNIQPFPLKDMSNKIEGVFDCYRLLPDRVVKSQMVITHKEGVSWLEFVEQWEREGELFEYWGYVFPTRDFLYFFGFNRKHGVPKMMFGRVLTSRGGAVSIRGISSAHAPDVTGIISGNILLEKCEHVSGGFGNPRRGIALEKTGDTTLLESAEFSATLLRLVTCAHSRRARVR